MPNKNGCDDGPEDEFIEGDERSAHINKVLFEKYLNIWKEYHVGTESED